MLHSQPSVDPTKATPIPLSSLNLVDDGSLDDPWSLIESSDSESSQASNNNDSDSESKEEGSGPFTDPVIHDNTDDELPSWVATTLWGCIQKTHTFGELS